MRAKKEVSKNLNKTLTGKINMTNKEFRKFIEQNRKEVEEIMQDIEETSKRFDQKVKEILQHS